MRALVSAVPTSCAALASLAVSLDTTWVAATFFGRTSVSAAEMPASAMGSKSEYQPAEPCH
jgi:hypothetical protein